MWVSYSFLYFFCFRGGEKQFILQFVKHVRFQSSFSFIHHVSITDSRRHPAKVPSEDFVFSILHMLRVFPRHLHLWSSYFSEDIFWNRSLHVWNEGVTLVFAQHVKQLTGFRLKAHLYCSHMYLTSRTLVQTDKDEVAITVEAINYLVIRYTWITNLMH